MVAVGIVIVLGTDAVCRVRVAPPVLLHWEAFTSSLREIRSNTGAVVMMRCCVGSRMARIWSRFTWLSAVTTTFIGRPEPALAGVAGRRIRREDAARMGDAQSPRPIASAGRLTSPFSR